MPMWDLTLVVEAPDEESALDMFEEMIASICTCEPDDPDCPVLTGSMAPSEIEEND